MLFRLELPHISCKEIFLFESEREIDDYPSTLFNYFLAGIFTRSVVQIFAKKVAGENSVQIGPNFPAKSLIYIYIVYITSIFVNTFS